VSAEEDKGHFAHSPLPFAVFLKTIKNRTKTICTYCFGLFLKTINFQNRVPTLCGIIDHFKKITPQDFEGLKHFK
jgi:hypothetical protein